MNNDTLKSILKMSMQLKVVSLFFSFAVDNSYSHCQAAQCYILLFSRGHTTSVQKEEQQPQTKVNTIYQVWPFDDIVLLT